MGQKMARILTQKVARKKTQNNGPCLFSCHPCVAGGVLELLRDEDQPEDEERGDEVEDDGPLEELGWRFN